MKSTSVIILLLVLLQTGVPAAQEQLNFGDYFLDETMRIDLHLSGNSSEQTITLDKIFRQGPWAGNPSKLLDPFNNGIYYIKVYDIASNRLIFSRGFSCIFNEYRTTDPAIAGSKRTFHESALIPFPKRSILLVLESRDRQNLLHPTLTIKIDPGHNSIIKEDANENDRIYQALKNGAPHDKVDVLFLAEGYQAVEWDKFKGDVDRFVEVLFSIEPYQSRKDNFNASGVFRPSADSDVDHPTQRRYSNTVLDASFNSLETPRYMLPNNNPVMRDIAAAVPYDAIMIIANTSRYGGGGIYNDYAIFAADNARSVATCPHEFGHSFGGLADEYFSSQVAYNNLYPKGVEPIEPNITALLDPANPKWKRWLEKGIAVPTIYSEELAGKIGVFEGGGYAVEGLYRPMNNCLMRSGDLYCKVCEERLRRVIDHFSN